MRQLRVLWVTIFVSSALGAPQALQAADPVDRWGIAAGEDGGQAFPAAYVLGAKGAPSVMLRCESGGRASITASAPGLKVGQSYKVTYASAVNGSFSADLHYDKAMQLWKGSAATPLIHILAGSDAAVDVLVGEKKVGRLSLIGSGKAISSALSTCLGTDRSGPESDKKPALVAPLNVVSGFYVDQGSLCTDAYSAFYYDGKRAGVVMDDIGIAPDPIGKVTRERPGQFFLPNAEILVKRLGATNIQLTIQDTGPPMRLCPTSQIPQALRAIVK